MKNYYTIDILGIKRNLPIVKINDKFSIASFVMLGDTELNIKCAEELYKRLPIYDIDIIVCAEAKSVPLAQELSRLLKVNYIVLRKSIKSYMINPKSISIKSITTSQDQVLVIDQTQIDQLSGRNVLILDDVVSTGGSIKTVEKILDIYTQSKIVAKACVLLEDAGYQDKNLIYLQKLPIFQ